MVFFLNGGRNDEVCDRPVLCPFTDQLSAGIDRFDANLHKAGLLEHRFDLADLVPERDELDRYLEDTIVIDWQTPAVMQQAKGVQ